MPWAKTHQPCPCGKSHDAYATDAKGDGFCFSCSKYHKGDGAEDTSFSYQFIDWRGVRADTFRKFDCAIKVAPNGEPVAVRYPYGPNAAKVRTIGRKEFLSQGDMKSATLFGKDIFPSGCAEGVIVTEGELDALSAYQMAKLPAVSVRSASSAFKDCSNELEYLGGFAKIYICFDNDEPGKEATRRVASLFGNKAYHVKLAGRDKDANDFAQRGAADEFGNVVFYSRRFIPEEITSSFADVDRILNEGRKRPIVTYPFRELQAMTYGIGRGITLLTALEGQGKTEIVRAIEAHVLRTTDVNIGVIHLEESKQRSVQGLAGYELGIPLHLPDSIASIPDVSEAYRRLTRRDERVHLINYFDGDDPNHALELIRFLVAKCECKIVFLDHVSQLVSALDGDDERKKLDYFSTKLEQMTQELDFALVMVSHVNDNGQTRGSRYISKVANVRIDLSRDHLSPSSLTRNTTYLTVSKNRDGAITGPAGALFFDRDTFMIEEFDPEKHQEEFVRAQASD